MDMYYWTTKDGRKINVDDMDINHLRNVLKMILKNVEKQKLASELDARKNSILRKFEEEEINEIEEDYFDEFGFPEF